MPASFAARARGYRRIRAPGPENEKQKNTLIFFGRFGIITFGIRKSLYPEDRFLIYNEAEEGGNVMDAGRSSGVPVGRRRRARSVRTFLIR